MNRDTKAIATKIRENSEALDKALDVLAESELFTYAYIVVSEKVFSNVPGFEDIKCESSYLRGANQVLKQISDLPNQVVRMFDEVAIRQERVSPVISDDDITPPTH